jgi:hypothetical protein
LPRSLVAPQNKSTGSSAKRARAPRPKELKRASTPPLVRDWASASSASASSPSSRPHLYPSSARSSAGASPPPASAADDADHDHSSSSAAGSVPPTPRDEYRPLEPSPAALLAREWAWSGVRAPAWAAVAYPDDAPALFAPVAVPGGSGYYDLDLGLGLDMPFASKHPVSSVRTELPGPEDPLLDA